MWIHVIATSSDFGLCWFWAAAHRQWSTLPYGLFVVCYAKINKEPSRRKSHTMILININQPTNTIFNGSAVVSLRFCVYGHFRNIFESRRHAQKLWMTLVFICTWQTIPFIWNNFYNRINPSANEMCLMWCAHTRAKVTQFFSSFSFLFGYQSNEQLKSPWKWASAIKAVSVGTIMMEKYFVLKATHVYLFVFPFWWYCVLCCVSHFNWQYSSIWLKGV